MINAIRISDDVLKVLDCSTIRGNTLFLPSDPMDRKLYVQVNKCLEALGGKWSKKLKGHLFDTNPNDQIEEVVVTGLYVDSKKQFQFFETPRNIVERMLEFMCILPHHIILEPSAGHGAIADIVKELFPGNLIKVAELDPKKAVTLKSKGYDVWEGDFLLIPRNTTADRVIMNPPFSRQQDIEHVTHAYSLLNPGGVLVSIMSESPFFRTNKRAEDFRTLLSNNGFSERLPESSFRTSGTDVNTRIVVLRKPI